MSFSRGLLTWEGFECIFLACHVKLEMKKGGSLPFSRRVPRDNVFTLPRAQLACAVPLAELGLSQGAVGDLVRKQGS